MKSLVRWATALSLVGGTFLGTPLLGQLRALALPEDRIVQKLNSVPVFIITNAEGSLLTRPLPITGKNSQGATDTLTGVYLSRQEAQAFVDQLRGNKDQDPNLAALAKTLQVEPVPLGVIYQKMRDANKQPNHLVFSFKAVQHQVDAAIAALRQSGQKLDQFTGVPLFIVRTGPNQGYVSITNPKNNQPIIPLFLSQDDAQILLAQVKTKYPAADLQVADLDSVINNWRTKNDNWLNQVVLVPDSDARDFLRTLPQGQNSGASQPATPPNQPH